MTAYEKVLVLVLGRQIVVAIKEVLRMKMMFLGMLRSVMHILLFSMLKGRSLYG
jgi:hypothetical protein